MWQSSSLISHMRNIKACRSCMILTPFQSLTYVVSGKSSGFKVTAAKTSACSWQRNADPLCMYCARCRDLVFPHHENEIAQSQAAAGCGCDKELLATTAETLCGTGCTTALSMWTAEKMSKSLGNFFTIRDVRALVGAPAPVAACR